jgi:lactose/cellobiose-specific phosphotransferase system IIC component
MVCLRNDYEHFIRAMYEISSNRTMTAIRQGLINMMPLMIIGSFAVLVCNLPIDSFRGFMVWVFGERWEDVSVYIMNGTNRVMSLGVLLSVSYSIARSRASVRTGEVSPFVVSLVSLGCLLAVTDARNDSFSFSQLGPTGLFLAVAVAISSSYLFFFFHKHKLFRVRIFTDVADTSLMQSLSAFEPAVWTFVIFALVKFLASLAGVNDLHEFLYDILRSVFDFLHGNFASAILFVLSTQLFWFCGLHGNNILENVTQRLWVPKLAENIAAVQAGGQATEIFSKQFFDAYVLLGGSGSTICLIAAILMAARNSNSSKVANISIPLAIFNINETMIYGIPIVFNPFYMIPFLLVPAALVTVSYLATRMGLVPVITNEVTWVTPIFISGYAVTESWRGAALQLVNFMIGTLMYLPFVKMGEKFKEHANRGVLQKLNDQINYIDYRRAPILIGRPDEVGSLARVLANDLQHDAAVDNQGLYLVYQPQFDNAGKIIGCEALLRWRHYKFGIIPPYTTITISEEAKLDDLLNKWIFETALRQLKYINDLGHMDLVMSVNISPLQLHNPDVVSTLQNLIAEYGLDPKTIEVELTENIAFDNSQESKGVLDKFKKIGVRLAIDDFGMGYTSLLYLRTFEVDTVKLDGSLVKDMMTDPNTVDIIAAIISLSNNLGIHVIAEVVETKEQRDKLRELGCHIYQGYYYSRPLEINDFIQFLDDSGRE